MNGDHSSLIDRSNGTPDRAFGTGGSVRNYITGSDSTDDVAWGVGVEPDGKIVVCGTSTGAPGGSSTAFAVSRYLAANPVTIALPEAPLLVSPVTATGQPRRATFSWRSSAMATSNRVVVAPDSSFVSLLADTTEVDTVVEIADALAAGTKYFWCVAASDSFGAGALPPTDSFVTGAGILDVAAREGRPRE